MLVFLLSKIRLCKFCGLDLFELLAKTLLVSDKFEIEEDALLVYLDVAAPSQHPPEANFKTFFLIFPSLVSEFVNTS